jgi:hypothetical protein
MNQFPRHFKKLHQITPKKTHLLLLGPGRGRRRRSHQVLADHRRDGGGEQIGATTWPEAAAGLPAAGDGEGRGRGGAE